jgi:hypothetical protein
MLDHVVQTHAGSRASSRYSSTFESSRRPMLGFEMPNSPRVESHGNVHGRNNNGDCSSNGPRTGIEGLLYWPRIVYFLGTPVVEQSFVLESTLNSAKGTAPAPRYKQYGIRENDLPTLCRRFLVYVHIRNPILEPGELEQYAKELSETGIKWDSKSCLVVCGFPIQFPVYRIFLIIRFSYWHVDLAVWLPKSMINTTRTWMITQSKMMHLMPGQKHIMKQHASASVLLVQNS